MTTRLAVNKKFDNRLEYQECNGCKRLGSELYFEKGTLVAKGIKARYLFTKNS
jgi:hypothetical protein